MNVWGLGIILVGFLMLYVGIKGTQGNLVKVFSKGGSSG